MKIGQNIFKSSLTIFVSFLILGLMFTINNLEIPRIVQPSMSVGFYGMVVGLVIKKWER